MDGIVGGVPASGPSGWQGGEVFSEVQRWNRIEADGQMKTPCLPPLQTNSEIAIMSTTGRWASATVSWLVDLLHDIVKGPIK